MTLIRYQKSYCKPKKKNLPYYPCSNIKTLLQLKVCYPYYKFESGFLNEFWIELKDKNPFLTEKAILTLLSFISTYHCETGFFSYVYT